MIQILAYKDVPKSLIEYSMTAVFGGTQKSDFYRFDFMVCFFDENMMPESFTLCQEISAEHIWLAYGGTLPSKRGAQTIRNFRTMIDHLSKKYKNIGAQVLNDNFPMLKIYVSHDFKISGVRQNTNGQVYVEFLKSFKGE
jgi:hypothetical protein